MKKIETLLAVMMVFTMVFSLAARGNTSSEVNSGTHTTEAHNASAEMSRKRTFRSGSAVQSSGCSCETACRIICFSACRLRFWTTYAAYCEYMGKLLAHRTRDGQVKYLKEKGIN